MSDAPVLEAVALTRSFPSGGRTLEVLRGVDLTLSRGEVGAVVGPSGSGKSTLLHCLGGLDRPTSGIVRVAGRNLADLSNGELARVRNGEIGFVFQFHHLLPDFSAVENVMLPQLIAGVPRDRARGHAEDLLRDVDLGDRLTHAPSELSGGEQQRVAVCRALANDPAVVLADEPSGNLDVAASRALHELLDRLRRERGATFLIATHDMDLAARADRIVAIVDGHLETEAGVPPAPSPVRAGS